MNPQLSPDCPGHEFGEFIRPKAPDSSADIAGAISSSSPPSGGKVCLVCGDRGTGFHYSVFTCEGCKAFFKRHLSKNTKYSCKHREVCQITKQTRNQCPSCRLQKCVALGMRKEAQSTSTATGIVRSESPVKSNLETEACVPGASKLRTHQPESCPEEIPEVYQLLIQTSVEANPFIIPKFQPEDMPAGGNFSPPLLDTPIGSPFDLGMGGSGVDMPPMPQDPMVVLRTTHIELLDVIDWAKKVHGFSTLLVKEQISLLRNTFMLHSVSRLAYRSMLASKDTFMVAEGVCIPRHGMVLMGFPAQLIQETLTTIKAFLDLAIDETEYALLSCICLFSPECDEHAADFSDTIYELRNDYLEALRWYMWKKDYKSHPRRFTSLLLLMPSIKLQSCIAQEWFAKMVDQDKAQSGELVSELFHKKLNLKPVNTPMTPPSDFSVYSGNAKNEPQASNASPPQFHDG